MNNSQILEETAKLVDAWCERRCLKALSFVLQGFPLHSPHTDGWGDLLQGLLATKDYARRELTLDEAEKLDAIIAAMRSWKW